MANWPAALPQSVLIESLQESVQDARVRTTMDSGPDFVRRRYSAVTTGYAGSMVLTSAQVAALKTFWTTTLNGGVDTFSWHPEGKHQASPQVILTMRFMSPPTYRSLGADLWQVDLSLEALP